MASSRVPWKEMASNLGDDQVSDILGSSVEFTFEEQSFILNQMKVGRLDKKVLETGIKGASTSMPKLMDMLAAIAGSTHHEGTACINDLAGASLTELRCRVDLMEYNLETPREGLEDGISNLGAFLLDVLESYAGYDILRLILGTVFVSGLLIKYDITEFQTFVQEKLLAIASSKGCPQMERFPTDNKTLAELKAIVSPGSKFSKTLYCLIVGGISSPVWKDFTIAMVGQRLNGYGMATLGLFMQAAEKLALTPGEMITETRHHHFYQSILRLYNFLEKLKLLKFDYQKAGLLMCRILSPTYYTDMAIKKNAAYAQLLASTLEETGEETLAKLEGMTLPTPMKRRIKTAAKRLVSMYMNLDHDNDGATIYKDGNFDDEDDNPSGTSEDEFESADEDDPFG